MPDHIHILAEGTSLTADALEFVRYFKQRTGLQFKQQTHKSLWEFSSYDHILPAQDEVVEVARYIWWNPVRKKLCKFPRDYPFSGSQTLNWMQQSSMEPNWAAPYCRARTAKAPV
jgi:REP element-mobilizing transposase RayT